MEHQETSRRLDAVESGLSEVRTRQAEYVTKHHAIELDMVKMRADTTYIMKSVDGISTGIRTLLFVVIGAFITAIITFIIRGGLSI